MPKQFKNPILPGFNPDASVLKVGTDYYLTTSTFEWWPGIEIYHSRDLINWQLVDNPLTRVDQADLRGNYNSGSIWAPHLSYAQHKFWLIYTDVKTTGTYKDTLNYLISADQIGGTWSAPTFLMASGFDPSIFHDDDGHSYVLNMLYDHRLDRPGFAGLVIQELNLTQRQLIGRRVHFFTGTDLGVCEGPQLLKKDGWYYLLSAAGGTGYSHAAAVCRSRQVMGPYEVSPYQPLLTTKDDPSNPLQKAGHASFIETQSDEWYLVHIMARPLRPINVQRGNCPLGRETGLQRLVWINDWPRLANHTNHPDLYFEAPTIAQDVVQRTDYSQQIDFGQINKLPLTLKTLRGPLEQRVSLTDHPGYLRLYGSQSITSLHTQTLLARRWQSFDFRVETQVTFSPNNFQQLAGLTLFYDTDNYEYLQWSYDETCQQAYLQLEVAELGEHHYASKRRYLTAKTVKLAVIVQKTQSQFYYDEGRGWQLIGTSLPAERLSDDYIKDHGKLAFTGAMVGICAQDLDQHLSYADFKYFNYQEQSD
ncbi:glycoside hydrolase family 43 protein [Lactiplantibacillus daoliensis]|uniref:Glycoside hydrolase family 43 protein n=1 Tax=Lactiplantibacillus daoliensis TaxID=2559916 RepID=A0ABW1UIJ1_9LACO|nr:glycoside hydrolase family 43 protein [Lactiplantibacillus daoliensis]